MSHYQIYITLFLAVWPPSSLSLLGESVGNVTFPTVAEKAAREYLNRLGIYKFVTSWDGMHPCMQRELANVIARPYSLIFERSW